MELTFLLLPRNSPEPRKARIKKLFHSLAPFLTTTTMTRIWVVLGETSMEVIEQIDTYVAQYLLVPQVNRCQGHSAPSTPCAKLAK